MDKIKSHKTKSDLLLLYFHPCFVGLKDQIGVCLPNRNGRYNKGNSKIEDRPKVRKNHMARDYSTTHTQ